MHVTFATRPKVTFDETTKQRLQETRQPLSAQLGRQQRYDCDYARNGTCNLFLCVEPPAGWRPVQVTARQTKRDFAHARQWLGDAGSPAATGMRVVLDNLNPHKIASLYEAFEPAAARRLARKRELPYPPKPGSWLNMAESELSVLQHQCRERRLPDEATLKREIAAWEKPRNAEQATMDWRFSIADARQQLTRLYPSLPS
jgi:hypothetical protein